MSGRLGFPTEGGGESPSWPRTKSKVQGRVREGVGGSGSLLGRPSRLPTGRRGSQQKLEDEDEDEAVTGLAHRRGGLEPVQEGWLCQAPHT